MGDGFTFTAPLWRWTARQGSADTGAWCFVTLPPDVVDELTGTLSVGGAG